jgi:glycosyltransferase involved in cell wall biosynthesis
MRVAITTTDNRAHLKQYDLQAPWLSSPVEVLLDSFQSAGIELHIVSCTRRRMRSPDKLAPNIFFHSLYVPKIGWMRTLFQGCVRAIRKKLKEIQPAIVHGQGTEEAYSLAAALSGFPNVLTIHGNMRLIARLSKARVFSYPWLAARLEGWTIPRSQGVICITRHTQQEVAGLARRTWVVPNAAHSSFFEVKPVADAASPPRILCAARVCELKNQNVLIRSLDSLVRQHKFELVFLGGLNERDPYCQEFIQLVKDRPWCKWEGHASRDQLQIYLGGATLLILSSLEENCPLVVLEAMAAGVPVVASRVGGVPDLITEGETGLLCDPRNSANISGQIEKALARPAAMVEMAGRAKKLARERFHPEVVARRHLEIYREVLAHPLDP